MAKKGAEDLEKHDFQTSYYSSGKTQAKGNCEAFMADQAHRLCLVSKGSAICHTNSS